MITYFDNAATTYPKPEEVYSFMDTFYRENGGNAGRGQYKLAGSASRIISETREMLKALLNCPNKEVIFTPSNTIAMNMVLQGTISDYIHTVYISPFEHNAVTRVLHNFEDSGRIEVKILPINPDFTYCLRRIEESFDEFPPDLVVMSHASNVCGIVAPVEDISHLAKKHGAITVVDIAQTAGIIPINLGSDDIDYAVFAGHKTLYGPIGIGGFIKSVGLNPKPVLFGGTGVESANQSMPNDSPARYEMGSQNILSIAGLYAALQWFSGRKAEIIETEEQNHKKLYDLLKSYKNITVIGPCDRSSCIGVVSCIFDGYSSDNIGDVLDRFDIAVRTGLHCSPIAHKTLGTFPAGTVRLSAGYFTRDIDFSTLKKALDFIEENS